MNKKTKISTEEILKNVQQLAKLNEFEIANYKNMFKELNTIKKGSLNDIISEEIPLILKQDLLFFKKHSINLPKNHEEYLFDIYYQQGRERLESIYWKTKIFFREFSYLLENFPNSQELSHAIDVYKNILEGNFSD